MADLQTIDPTLFFSRRDPADPRLGDLVQKSESSASPQVAIVGFPDDAGIELNGGRKGAAAGPSEIRRWLYRMTPHPCREVKTLIDIGDLKIEGELGDRHQKAARIVSQQLQKGRQVLSLGGGNDYAYADGLALLDYCKSEMPLIINIDAHLDVRDTSKGLTSGTPFYRLLESDHKFDFVELGIQTHCNSKTHWDYVLKKGGRIITLEETRADGRPLQEFVLQIIGEQVLRRRPAFLAIDMDAFAWPYAQGTSAAWPLGLLPDEFMPLLSTLLRRLDVYVLGIYETSPPLDSGGGTARLAAQLAHGFLHV